MVVTACFFNSIHSISLNDLVQCYVSHKEILLFLIGIYCLLICNSMLLYDGTSLIKGEIDQFITIPVAILYTSIKSPVTLVLSGLISHPI